MVSVVPVPDPRYDFAITLFHPKKRTPATIEFTDGAAQISGGERRRPEVRRGLLRRHPLGGRPGAGRPRLRDPSLPPPDGGLNPLRDYQAITEELLLGDLSVIETRLERIEKQLKTRKAGQPSPEVTEREILLKIKAALDDFKPVAGVDLTEDELRIVKNFDFLTAKPLIAVANVGEADIAEGDALPLLQPLREQCAGEGVPFIALCAAAEREVSQLAEEDQREFLDALGIAEPARGRLIRAAYQALGVQSFFTVGEDEVRAWTIPAGANALTAAGRIHSDLARGFIRAEVMAFQELMDAGTWDAAKAAGKLRLEGREYIVKDGDILHVRFKV